MTFLNLSLFLGGSLLVAVPIILHLIMRRKPMLLEFPALRFLQKRHDANQRRLRLRHLLLLLLRAGAIALLAFALARPSLKFGRTYGSQEAPVAAALVFDVAPHMEYRHQNRSRLEAARELGLWLLAQLPRESQIAVLDSGLVQKGFDADRGVAKQRIERLKPAANAQPVALATAEAIALLAQSDLPQKELYVFTDLSAADWPADCGPVLQNRLTKYPGTALYVIDVGVANPANFALGKLRLSGEVLPRGAGLDISCDLSCAGLAGQRSVELYVLDAAGRPQKQGEQTATLAAGESRQLEFHLGDLEIGTHQGSLRIVGRDGLEADDVRFFSVEVKPAWPVLVAAPPPAEDYALFFTQALAPTVMRKRGQARFDCQVVSLADLPRQALEKYAAVCLLDPTPLEPGVWQRLAEYAAAGHGVAVFLGRNAQKIESFNSPAAQQLLPGKLLREARRPDGDCCLAPRDFQHPILTAFGRHATSIPWDAFPVVRYWELQRPIGTVLPFVDGRPALLERTIGSGRAVTMTTPVSDRPTQDAWNYLPAGEAWPFVILMNQTLAYLVGGTQQQLNYYAGQAAVLPMDEQSRRLNYLLSAPGNEKYPLSADPKQHAITVTATEQVGNYRLQAGGRVSGVDRGFSVNLAPDATRLDRLDEKQLAEIFGPFKYRLAHTRDQIDRNISMGRVGRELYPPAIIIFALVLALEYVVANRFYKE
ncbi:MAG: BatA domain-containing protein [Thermoguttaceae bacterium]|jgi:hypothetical protein